MTVSDLISEKGNPSQEKNLPETKGKILHYENEETFQVQGEIVVNSFRRPTSEEATLLYWKNRFRDCDSVERVISTEMHGTHEKELSCPSMGLAVIFTDGSEYVSRVVENEVK